MKQHTTPILIKDEKALTLEKVTLNTNSYNEYWETPKLIGKESPKLFILKPNTGDRIPEGKITSLEMLLGEEWKSKPITTQAIKRIRKLGY